MKPLITFLVLITLLVQASFARENTTSQLITDGLQTSLVELLQIRLHQNRDKLSNPMELKKLYATLKDSSVKKQLDVALASVTPADLKRVSVSPDETSVTLELDGESVSLNFSSNTLVFKGKSIDLSQKTIDQVTAELLGATKTAFNPMDLLIPRAHAFIQPFLILILAVVGVLVLASTGFQAIVAALRVFDCRTILSQFKQTLKDRYESCWVHGDDPFPFKKDQSLVELLNRFEGPGKLFDERSCRAQIKNEFKAEFGFFGNRTNMSCIGLAADEVCSDMRMLYKCSQNRSRSVNTSERAPGERESSPATGAGAPAAGAQAR